MQKDFATYGGDQGFIKILESFTIFNYYRNVEGHEKCTPTSSESVANQYRGK
jgi:hypothetical protein